MWEERRRRWSGYQKQIYDKKEKIKMMKKGSWRRKNEKESSIIKE